MQDARCLERRQRLGSPAICLEELPTWNSCHSLIPQTPAGILHFVNLAAVTGRFDLPIGKIICSLPLLPPPSSPPPPTPAPTTWHGGTSAQTTSSPLEPLEGDIACTISQPGFTFCVGCVHVCVSAQQLHQQSKWLPLNTTTRLSQTREATQCDAV